MSSLCSRGYKSPQFGSIVRTQIRTEETDYRTAKQVKRNKIKSVFDKSIAKGNGAKADRIKRNNLGKIKWNNRETSLKED
jgi:hypothetical protein